MSDSDKSIFRQQALEQLSSPEQLDQPLTMVSRNSWLTLFAVALLMAAALVWSVWGDIPITIEGSGILVFPRQVVTMQSTTQGSIGQLHVQQGDQVIKGQLLISIKQPEIEQKLQQQQERIDDLQTRKQRLTGLSVQKMQLEKLSIKKRQANLKNKISINLKQVRIKQRLVQTLSDRFKNAKKLKLQNLVSETLVLNARREMIDAEEAQQQLQVSVAENKNQLQQLDVELARLEHDRVQQKSDINLQIQKVQQGIERLQQELQTQGKIRSSSNGRILELSVATGSFVNAGQDLLALEVEQQDGKLVALGYFSVADGKRIKPGMKVRITPSTIQRERYGSILGVATEISRFAVSADSVRYLIGNKELATQLLAGQGRIQVLSELGREATSPSGFLWSAGQGPDLEITAGTTMQIRVTVEQRSPISYVIPILRSWSGT